MPDSVVYEISRWLIFNFASGRADISGQDWGDIFAKSIDGEHLASPLGLADVVIEGQAWSVKSVKTDKPHSLKKIRLISGRNSPDYSHGIENPRDDIKNTGESVIGIWNERVSIALDHYDSLRTAILVRNVIQLEFTLFEKEVERYSANDFVWTVNKRGNFEGRRKSNNQHVFTWQPHGSQFTVIEEIPGSAIRFRLKRPPLIDFEDTMKQLKFDESWIDIIE